MLNKIKRLISKNKEYKEMELKGELDTGTKDIVTTSKVMCLYSIAPIAYAFGISYILSVITKVEQGVYLWYVMLAVWAIWYKHTVLMLHSAIVGAKNDMDQEANKKSSFKQITTNKNTAT